jgi:porphobilinogen synthase
MYIIVFSDFIYPLFIHDDETKEEISSMPDCYRFSLNLMLKEVEEAVQ